MPPAWICSFIYYLLQFSSFSPLMTFVCVNSASPPWSAFILFLFLFSYISFMWPWWCCCGVAVAVAVLVCGGCGCRIGDCIGEAKTVHKAAYKTAYKKIATKKSWIMLHKAAKSNSKKASVLSACKHASDNERKKKMGGMRIILNGAIRPPAWAIRKKLFSQEVPVIITDSFNGFATINSQS